MPRDYIDIGPCPPDEECEQVGPNYDSVKARRQMDAYIRQLRRELGPEPEGARLAIKSHPHDFGSYSDVVCYYDTDNEAAAEYAFKCEGEGPANWDDKALIELAKYYRSYDKRLM